MILKIFLDTNVLVSAVATRGLCTDVLREVLASHQIIISPSLIDELRRVLRLKIGLPEEIINDYIDLLRQDAIEAGELIHLSLDINDEDDIKIISEAISGGATLFVTGDKELLNIETFQHMLIVTPRGFWELLKIEKPGNRD